MDKDRAESLKDIIARLDKTFGKRANSTPAPTVEEIRARQRRIEAEDFYTWLSKGKARGWVTDSFCNTHDGDPYMTPEEEKEWDEGGDPCMVVIKVLFGQ